VSIQDDVTKAGKAEDRKTIWRPSHHLKSNGNAKYVLGLGMLPKLYKGRIHVLAKVSKVLK
jgi:hypothetical protein